MAVILLCLFLFALLIDRKMNIGDIHQAARCGDCARLQKMLTKDRSLANARNGSDAAFLRPLPEKFKDSLDSLLDETGFTVPFENRGNETPLHISAQYGHLDAAALLIKNGAEVNAADSSGDTPLHYAKTKVIAELLIAHGASISAKNNSGFTPLHYVRALSQSIEIGRLLIENGADANAKSAAGLTPLHFAADRNYLSFAELLLSSGADPDARTEDGLTPLMMAVSRGCREMADLLRMHGADDNDIWTAIESGNVCLVKVMLKKDHELIQSTDQDGNTPLHTAARFNEMNAAKLLIDSGAEVECTNRYDQTPLHWAAAGDSRKTAELLITRGARINAQDVNGYTPLHRAVENGSRSVVNLLISKDAEAYIRDRYGLTPIELAIDKKEKSMFYELTCPLVESVQKSRSSSLSLFPLDNIYSLKEICVKRLETEPHDVIALKGLADCYYRMSRYRDAEIFYNKAQKEEPADRRLWRSAQNAAQMQRLTEKTKSLLPAGHSIVHIVPFYLDGRDQIAVMSARVVKRNAQGHFGLMTDIYVTVFTKSGEEIVKSWRSEKLIITCYGERSSMSTFATLHAEDVTGSGKPSIIACQTIFGANHAKTNLVIYRPSGGSWEKIFCGDCDEPGVLRDLDNDGRFEVLMSRCPWIAGLSHAENPPWLSIYSYDGSSYVPADKRFPYEYRQIRGRLISLSKEYPDLSELHYYLGRVYEIFDNPCEALKAYRISDKSSKWRGKENLARRRIEAIEKTGKCD